MIEACPTLTEQDVLAALQRVSDPELDESIVDLQFVDRVRVDGSQVELVLRLPTFWCAPNFAYLMAYDARAQVLSLPGVRDVRVLGAIGVVQLARPVDVAAATAAAVARGVWLRPFRDLVYTMPPYVADQEDVARITAAVVAAAAAGGAG